uniref:Reverse transcriptase n=1 Tax=Cannabis sativa TaxID=3483 RepID=A0A803P3J7_CANSA
MEGPSDGSSLAIIHQKSVRADPRIMEAGNEKDVVMDPNEKHVETQLGQLGELDKDNGKSEARGHTGGLAMLWKNQDDGKLLSFSNNRIDLELKLEGYPLFRASGFYGEPQRSLCGNSWRLIRQLAGESNLPWCLMGDLNNVLHLSDKRGGRSYPGWLIQGFQDMVSECNLIDMELVGYLFTWEKGKGTATWVEVRLGRALINQEEFSALIREYERVGKILGCKVARGAPVLSHMFFADDCYVFCKAYEDSTINVIEMLRIFQKASGQQVNLQKSSIFFSANTVNGVKQRVCSTLGVNEAGEESTYLGLPNIVRGNKTALLGFLKDKMRKRIQGWEGRLLSRAGKELLIKTVAQSLPSYAMNVFLLPVKTCNEMEQLMCKFWWRSSKNNKGIHWKKWDDLAVHKSKGGMEF